MTQPTPRVRTAPTPSGPDRRAPAAISPTYHDLGGTRPETRTTTTENPRNARHPTISVIQVQHPEPRSPRTRPAHVSTRVGWWGRSSVDGMKNESTIADENTESAAASATADEQVVEEQLIEEISIDGMCGVD